MRQLITILLTLFAFSYSAAQVDDATGTATAESIRTATTAGSNTAAIVGGNIKNLWLSKGNKQEANTWTGKQTFTPTATVAGINIGTISGNPSSPANGDFWYNNSTSQLMTRINTLNRMVANIGTVVSSGIGYFPSASSGGMETEAGFTYDAPTNTFSTPIAILGTGTPVTSGNISTVIYSGSAASGNRIAQAINIRQSASSTGVFFGDYVKSYADHSSGTVNQLLAIQGNAENAAAGTVTDARGILGGTLTTNGPITNAIGVRAEGVFIAGNAAVTNSYGLHVSGATIGSGSVTNNFGIFQSGSSVVNELEGTTQLNQIPLSQGGVVYAASYTPTATIIANLDDTDLNDIHYIRIGNQVIMSGQFDADATAAAGTTTRFRITIPVATNFVGADQAGGAGNFQGVAGQAVSVYADTTNEEIIFHWLSQTTANQSFTWIVKYLIQ